MIQFNLLPDIKIEFMRTMRLKRIILVIAIIASAAAVLILLLAFSLVSAQKKHIDNLSKDINKTKQAIDEVQNLDKILTVQNQLNNLPALYDGRPAATRLPTYIQQVTPEDVGLTKVVVDFAASTMSLAGKSESLHNVNRFVDTLKFTSYKVKDSEETVPAFKDIVLAEFERDEAEATFTITLTFDPQIFNQNQQVNLLIPTGVTTRSNTELPGQELFVGTPEEEEEAE